MTKDPIAALFYGRLPDVFPEYQLVALDGHDNVVGRINAVPFLWGGADEDLPDRGWDAILERAFEDYERDRHPDAVSLLEARVVPEHQGKGLSTHLLQGARDNVHQLGFDALVGPVRPTGKAKEPFAPMAEYVARVRSDGLPADGWIRAHARLGARIVKICPVSMTIVGTVTEWREWTGLPLTESGLIPIPDALTPLYVSLEHDYAVYVEPNLWMQHKLA